MRLNFFIFILVTIFSLSIALNSSAEVLFGDHFDTQPDWNMSQSSSLLEGWSAKMGQNRGGSYEVGYINSEGAHGTSGKGFVQYWDKTSSYSYAQDCWLVKNNLAYPNEWYLGYWFRIDPNWDWGSAANLKLLKIHFNNSETMDIFWTAFCAGCPDWRLPSGTVRSLCTDQYGKNWAGSWSKIADGNWHYFIWRFKHDTGIIELYVVNDHYQHQVRNYTQQVL